MFLRASDSAHQFAIMQMLIAVILANMNPIFSKVLFSRGWTPLSVYFLIMLIIAIVLIVHEFMDRNRHIRWSMSKRDLAGVLLTTATGGVLSPMLFFTGLQYVSASDTLILTSALPFFVVVFGVILLKEHFTKQMFFGGLLIVSGVAVMMWPDLSQFDIKPGALFLLGSSVCGALTTIFHKKYVTFRHLDAIVLVRTLVSILLVGTWVLFNEPQTFKMLSTPENIWIVLALPILSYIFPYFLFFGAIKFVKAFEVGVLEAAGRVFAVIAASVLLKENLNSMHLASIILIVFGVISINVPLTKWRIVPSRLMEAGPLRK